MKEENLSSSVEFIIYDTLDFILVKQNYLGLHRDSVGWGSVDYAEVPGTKERELQSARNRGCGESQGVHGCLYLPEFFFCTHSELLLLIYDKKTQILELEFFT